MVIIKKIKDKFFEKQADFIIYTHNHKSWIYKVSGEPINDVDIQLLMNPKLDCLCGCHTMNNVMCGECYRKSCIRSRMKPTSQNFSNGGIK